jgi:hypothetical protein
MPDDGTRISWEWVEGTVFKNQCNHALALSCSVSGGAPDWHFTWQRSVCVPGSDTPTGRFLLNDVPLNNIRRRGDLRGLVKLLTGRPAEF